VLLWIHVRTIIMSINPFPLSAVFALEMLITGYLLLVCAF
jgi:hypothetical protein